MVQPRKATAGCAGSPAIRGNGLGGACFGRGHRLSADLDLFTGGATMAEAGPAVEAAWRVAGIAARAEKRYSTFTRLWVGERPVKVELAQDSPYRLAPSSVTVDGMPTRSLPDLAADQTLALFGRVTTRDFVDVYMLLQRYELSQLMAWTAENDPGLDRDWSIRALVQSAKAQRNGLQCSFR
ncbi:MAG: nucleotidyl transferase AbiEii/AbiGii toxin family protein [Thermaerobacter sp.]|nr:nucleotidyl transferase AbiEii/AbiGii toxin family protein [Thermaerobacter sp.]